MSMYRNVTKSDDNMTLPLLISFPCFIPLASISNKKLRRDETAVPHTNLNELASNFPHLRECWLILL